VYLSPLSFFLVAKHERRKHKNGDKKEELSYEKKPIKKKKTGQKPSSAFHLAPSPTQLPFYSSVHFLPMMIPPPEINQPAAALVRAGRQKPNRQTNAPFTPPTRSF
jgi:hypothetical protein